MAEASALRGLPPEDLALPAECFFEALPWKGTPSMKLEPAEVPAGAFLEAL